MVYVFLNRQHGELWLHDLSRVVKDVVDVVQVLLLEVLTSWRHGLAQCVQMLRVRDRSGQAHDKVFSHRIVTALLIVWHLLVVLSEHLANLDGQELYLFVINHKHVVVTFSLIVGIALAFAILFFNGLKVRPVELMLDPHKVCSPESCTFCLCKRILSAHVTDLTILVGLDRVELDTMAGLCLMHQAIIIRFFAVHTAVIFRPHASS